MKAIWNGAVIAQSDDTVVVEGNHYFPHDSVDQQYIDQSGTHTVCPYKGTASYYSLKVAGKTNADAAWYYPEVKDLYSEIQNRVAFWRGVEVVD
jgi:uncharacterized protein (DUF427 family)